MSKLFIFIFLIISFSGHSQNNSSKLKIKKTLETETYGVWDSNGKKYVYVSETNEYHYNIEELEIFHIRTTYHNKTPYRTTQTTFFYNTKNKISYTSTFILEDSICYKTTYNYLNNRLDKISALFSINNKQSKYKEHYFYDTKGKLVKRNYLYSEKYPDTNIGQRDLVAEFTYNKKEQIIESDWTKSDSSYKFNRIVHIRNHKGIRTKEKEYDKNNHLIKTTHFKYVYDKNNNWVIRKEYEKKLLVRSTHRDIEYF